MKVFNFTENQSLTICRLEVDYGSVTLYYRNRPNKGWVFEVTSTEVLEKVNTHAIFVDNELTDNSSLGLALSKMIKSKDIICVKTVIKEPFYTDMNSDKLTTIR